MTMISDKKRILIIDDNTQIHLDFKKVLLISKEKESDLDKLEEALLGKTPDQQDETYSIDYASQGEEGFKMVEASIKDKEPYAVAFIDIRMPPGWNGIETISKIWEIYPDLQIVICTAYSDYSWDDLFNKFGHTDKLLILKKPFDNIEVRQLTYTLSKKWELNRIANLKLDELERNVKERTKELQQSEEKYRTMIENSNDMIWTLDKEGCFLYHNKKSEEITNYSIKEGIGKPFTPIILEEDLEMVQKVFLDTLAGNSNHYEVRIHDRSRTNIITISVNTTPMIKEEIVVGTVSFGRDITKQKIIENELKRTNRKLSALVRTDFLTELPNRLNILERIEYEMNKFARNKEPFIIIIGDLDNFKSINDEYGHSTGDKILKLVSQIMSSTLRKQDIVARWGGDEFLLLLPQTKMIGGKIIALKLEKEIAMSFISFQGKKISTSITFGLSIYDKIMDIDKCIKIADIELYKNKKNKSME